MAEMDSQHLLENWDFRTASIKGGHSWYWRKIMNLRSLFPVAILQDVTVLGKYSPAKCYDRLVDTSNTLTGYKQI